jgi:hypothetical protein
MLDSRFRAVEQLGDCVVQRGRQLTGSGSYRGAAE